MNEPAHLPFRKRAALAARTAAREANINNTQLERSNANVTENQEKQLQCVHCGTTNTPLWRKGPQGPNTLCNACGTRWKRHGSVTLRRPISTSTPESVAANQRIVKTERKVITQSNPVPFNNDGPAAAVRLRTRERRPRCSDCGTTMLSKERAERINPPPLCAQCEFDRRRGNPNISRRTSRIITKPNHSRATRAAAAAANANISLELSLNRITRASSAAAAVAATAPADDDDDDDDMDVIEKDKDHEFISVAEMDSSIVNAYTEPPQPVPWAAPDSIHLQSPPRKSSRAVASITSSGGPSKKSKTSKKESVVFVSKSKTAQILDSDENVPVAEPQFKCVSCGVTETPLWRKGPAGKNTLCNACGTRWKRHGSTVPRPGPGELITPIARKRKPPVNRRHRSPPPPLPPPPPEANVTMLSPPDEAIEGRDIPYLPSLVEVIPGGLEGIANEKKLSRSKRIRKRTARAQSYFDSLGSTAENKNMMKSISLKIPLRRLRMMREEQIVKKEEIKMEVDVINTDFNNASIYHDDMEMHKDGDEGVDKQGSAVIMNETWEFVREMLKEYVNKSMEPKSSHDSNVEIPISKNVGVGSTAVTVVSSDTSAVEEVKNTAEDAAILGTYSVKDVETTTEDAAALVSSSMKNVGMSVEDTTTLDVSSAKIVGITTEDLVSSDTSILNNVGSTAKAAVPLDKSDVKGIVDDLVNMAIQSSKSCTDGTELKKDEPLDIDTDDVNMESKEFVDSLVIDVSDEKKMDVTKEDLTELKEHPNEQMESNTHDEKSETKKCLDVDKCGEPNKRPDDLSPCADGNKCDEAMEHPRGSNSPCEGTKIIDEVKECTGEKMMMHSVDSNFDEAMERPNERPDSNSPLEGSKMKELSDDAICDETKDCIDVLPGSTSPRGVTKSKGHPGDVTGVNSAREVSKSKEGPGYRIGANSPREVSESKGLPSDIIDVNSPRKVSESKEDLGGLRDSNSAQEVSDSRKSPVDSSITNKAVEKVDSKDYSGGMIDVSSPRKVSESKELPGGLDDEKLADDESETRKRSREKMEEKRTFSVSSLMVDNVESPVALPDPKVRKTTESIAISNITTPAKAISDMEIGDGLMSIDEFEREYLAETNSDGLLTNGREGAGVDVEKSDGQETGTDVMDILKSIDQELGNGRVVDESKTDAQTLA